VGGKTIVERTDKPKPTIREERALERATAEAWAKEYIHRYEPRQEHSGLELVMQDRVLWLWRFRFGDQGVEEEPYWLVGGDLAHMVLRGNGEDTIKTAAECLVVYCWLIRLWYSHKGDPGEDAQRLLKPGSWTPILYVDPDGSSLWLGARDTFIQYKVLPDMLHEVHNPEVRDRMSRLGLYEGMFDPEVRARLTAIADERERKAKSAHKGGQSPKRERNP